jgi:hypothetical protein
VTRKNYIKTILGLIGASVATYSLADWFRMNSRLEVEDLYKKKALLGELVELIIPTTSTPGARAALVHEYVIRVILNCSDLKEQQTFYSGLKDLESFSITNYEKEFSKCTLLQKNSVLEHFARKSEYNYPIMGKINKKLFGQPFYLKLRSLTVEGYCQSQLGATQALMYDYLPGEYIGIMPVTPNQRSWATK